MDDIRMVDLTGQYQKIKAEVDKDIQDVIDATAFINGPKVNEFQKSLTDYLGTKHAITCGNGTDALQIAMMCLDLQPGDEIITTNFTFIATVEVIELLKLKTVLVDVNYDTFNIEPHLIEEAITDKTKAIVPVHLFGQCCNMEEIMRIANKHNLHVIEDAAQSFGSEYTFKDGTVKKAGTIGTIGCTSFFPSKNLGCFGDGGAIFTDDDALAQKMRSVVNHGMKVKYYYDNIGVNSRLDTIQAAVLNVKIKHIETYNAARLKAANYYNNAFKDVDNIDVPVKSEFTSHVFHQYTLKVKNIDRFALQEYLKSKGIPSMVYYPVPIHKQEPYENERYNKIDFSVSEKLSDSVISLPMHTELNEQQLEYISNNVVTFVNGIR